MDINTRLKYFGYGDLFISSVQIEVTSLTTILSMYYHLYNDNFEMGFLSTYFWLVANVVITVIVALINLSQIQSTRQLLRAANEESDTAEMEIRRNDWISRNKATVFVMLVWFPCFGMTTFWQHEWPLSLILGLFMGMAGSRGMVIWGIHGIKFGETIDIPDFPPDLMEEFIEMQRQRPRDHQTPMGNQGESMEG